jgi:drug/metabolite transporter (DMT)-like permease
VNGLALVVAACSAAGFAVSSALQHHANGDLPGDLGTAGTVRALLRRPRWVVGQGLALAAFLLHAGALRLGVLVLVQPVVVSGIVLAVPVRAALGRRLPGRGELATVAVTVAGLALFLVAANPRSTHPPATGLAVLATVVGGALAAAAALWAGRRHGAGQATGYGLACGVLFGLTAGLVKLAVADGALWAACAVVLTGLSGMALNQRAYRAAPLSASMPLLNVVDVLVAIGFGVVVFGETPAHGWAATSGQVVALVLMGWGLRRLARTESAAEPAEHVLAASASSGGR